MKNSKYRILLAASAGGHMSQLLKLCNAWQSSEVFFVTTSDVLKSKLEKKAPTYSVGEANRQQIFDAIVVWFRCMKIVFKKQPRIVISTGALHGCLLCYIAKVFFRSKVVWVDSITNTEKPSLSGRLVYPIADLFILQWEELLKTYPKAEFHGSVI